MYPLCLPVNMSAKKDKSSAKSKKTTSKKSTKKSSKSKAKSSKKSELTADDIGVIVIDEDITVDKSAELEARKAYLEEARSQESSDQD